MFEEGRNLLNFLEFTRILIPLRESIIWYKVYFVYMNSIYIIRVMLCYVQVFTILPEG